MILLGQSECGKLVDHKGFLSVSSDNDSVQNKFVPFVLCGP